ncbi:MAG: hypothetical protein GX574_15255, partial [Lentisphaerae bacterium]|nr:hypothetical protein [Lentisphaerota bacterium]
ITAVFDPITWHVDASRPDDDGDGRSWESAKKTIQAAIDAAEESDTILVTDGTYAPIDTTNKAITIRSVNGAKKTIIDGGGAARCATLGDFYSERKTVLEGFTLQNGYAKEYGGGAYRGTLTNCTLTGNSADWAGGGASYSDLTNCTLTGNTAGYGGGGGAYGGTLINCTLTGNSANNDGGGAYGGTLTNCAVIANSAGYAGGVYDCELYNCIVWGNSSPEYANYAYSSFMYSCTDPVPSVGEGNISADPRFVDAANGDCRLRVGSPCVDAGNNDYVEIETDLLGNSRIGNNCVDMGAYEGTVAGFVISGRVQNTGVLSPLMAILAAGDSATFTATETHGPFRHFEIAGVVVSESPTYTWENIQADGVITAVFDPITWHVDASRPDDDGDGRSWENAKQSIQAAIDAAEDGDTILVADGTYSPIASANKAIIIRSVNGAEKTIIDGGGVERCATLDDDNSERMTALEGFTLQNGYAEEDGGGAHGGTLNNCTLTGNSADYGGGAHNCILTNCTLTGNSADEFGGGAFDCTLTNCILAGNSASFSGGGACRGTLTNCTLAGNQADEGGGVWGCELYNCIAWGNSAPEAANYAYSSFMYSCTAPLPAEGGWNISDYPRFVDAENGDYRLRSGSPCVDAGSNDYVEVETDLAGNPRIGNNTVDMGAYEGGVEGFVISGWIQGKGLLSPMTAVVAPGGSATFTATATYAAFRHFEIDGVVVSDSSSYTWENIQADGVITAVFEPTTWYVAASRPDDGGDGFTWQTAKKTIQAAIDAAEDDDTILVKGGTYSPIDAANKVIAIRSINGAKKTIIDGGGVERCATLSGYGSEYNTILDGFTLRNGYAGDGGGASGGTLTNCTLTGNTAEYGGGASGCILINCTLARNFARTVEDGYTFWGWGGGVDDCTLTNCTLTGNQALKGGGAAGSTLTNCILTSNKAVAGYYYDDSFGGGAYSCTLTNCTVSNNSGRNGSGVSDCTLNNCIVWGNSGGNYVDSMFSYSCTSPLPSEDSGNICEDPQFVAAENGDFRLRAISPCVNAGSNEFVVAETDLAGHPRISGDRVDMGAYEGGIFVIIGQVQGQGKIVPSRAEAELGGSVTFQAIEGSRVFRHFEIDGVVVSESPTYTWENIQADGVITAVFDPVIWHVDASRPNDSGDGRSWETAMQSIQTAIDAAEEDDIILVTDGIYAPIDAANKAITIRSVNGAKKTIIDGVEVERCATFGESDAVMEGFTLQNGYATEGGGAYGGTLTNCTLTGNSAEFGGGAYNCCLEDCTLVGNTTLVASDGEDDEEGGGNADGDGDGENIGRSGGGACYSDLTNCTLTGNSAEVGGGAYHSILTNCTVTRNSANYCGGVYDCELYNCIVWGNSAPGNANHVESSFMYSCTEPMPSAGEGNISDDPRLVDAASGDCRLRVGSPCVDAGNNDYVEVATDLAGNPRISNGTVDMGAYEGSIEGFVISGRIQGKGLLSPMTAVVNPGGSTTFTATENHGSFRHFEIDGVVVSESPTYTWENIQADGVITAVFDPVIWHVDASRPNDGGDGRSWGTAMQSIQTAIDAAEEDDVILVTDGIYAPIDAANKAVTIRSVNGADKTIIDGGGMERCATFGESDAVMEGFTLQNGYATEGGGAYGGTLTNCTLTGNSARWYGGGAYNCCLDDCTLVGNTTLVASDEEGGENANGDGDGENIGRSGGGAYGCFLSNCSLTGNTATYGGGAYESTLINCTLSRNTAYYGGGTCGCFLSNCTLTGNSAEFGGGARGGTLDNCTVTGNSTTNAGGGVIGCDAYNCIVWENFAPEDANHRDSWFSYSCTSPLPVEGDGNISDDPRLVDAANGDCRLRVGSPCIDSGDNEFVAPENETDLAGNPRISNGTVDMGAYEGGIDGFVISGRIQGKGLLSPMTTVVLPGGSTTFTTTETYGPFRHFEIDGVVVSVSPTYTWENIQADGVITAVFDPMTWHVDASRPDDGGDGRTWGSAKKSIQAAIDAAEADDIILVTDGIYAPIRTVGKAVVIRSVNGAQKTIIDGNGVARCATLGDYGSGRKTVLEGFTLQNGYASEGGGACGGTLRHCTLANNGSPALIWYDHDFDFYCHQGGGAYDCALSYCLVQNNSARNGGGVCECVLDNCVLANNSAGTDEDESYGGGAYDSILTNCTLTGNQADYGGGACDSTLTNCTLSENQAHSGGGAYDSVLTNCTLSENQAGYGGGIADSEASNCIIWGNSAWVGTNYNESSLEHSCTYPLPSEGEGNIILAPGFVDAVNGDFRLRTGSPCIDAGDNSVVKAETDLAGNPRIGNEVVDMGAYEGAVDGCVISGRVQGNGALSPMTAVVAQGGAATFTATATDGAFLHFAVDGVVVSKSPTYTWNNIQADGVITAVFATGTWHVDAARPDDDGDGLSWTTALRSIQAAVDRAAAGDLVLVKPGVYAPIVTDDMAIAIRSVNGAATTIIDGGGRRRCATLSESYFGRQTILDGFTLRNGAATASGGGVFGGTVFNCRITNCLAEGDGGSEREDGGGGASHANLRNCTLSGNMAPYGGAAEYCTLDNCILTANQAYDFGGGAYSSLLSNCSITENVAKNYGGGVYNCTAYNSIIWNNQAKYEANYSLEWSADTALYFSCSEPLPPGVGNISGDPRFVDALHGDFRLRTGSPCIDAGDNGCVASATDLAGNPRIDNEKVDMGALEGMVEGWVISGRVQGNGTISPLTAVVAQGDSVTVTATATHGAFRHFLVDGEIVSESPIYTWNDIQADGIITAVFTSVTWHVDNARPDDVGDGLSWATAKKSIQAALDAANVGDQILVKPGVYEPIDGRSRGVTIRSLSCAEDTIIDGGGARRCALGAILEGFTLQNGLANNGGGTLACVLHRCILTGNTAESSGGGAYESTLSNCLLTGNTARIGGGAASSTLSNCLLTGNAAERVGGASRSTLSNCTVAGNSAEGWWGVGGVGGVDYCTLWNCIVSDNSGSYYNNYYDSNFMYSCSYPLPDGEGNISAVPGFIDAANGVYHLRLGSPCIDAGSNEYVQEGDTDLAGDERVGNEMVDMGAYERNTDEFIVLGKVQGRGKISPQTASMPPGGSVTFTAEETVARFLCFQIAGATVSTMPSFSWNEIEADGVITAVFAPAVLHVDATRPDDNGDGLSWTTAKRSLQVAVMAAHDGETILVRPGCYAPINTGKKSLIIRSVNGAKATIIDGGGIQRCATLGDGWSEDSTLLEGFTLQNGFAEDGGGASGGRLNRCIISSNTAEGNGGGAYKCRLTNCVLNRNYARYNSGGGAYDCQLSNCTLVGNAAGDEGGGISQCEATNCIVWDNSAAQAANYSDSQLRYSCTAAPLPKGDESGNNISDSPHFVDTVNGDFRLRIGSPCINAGDSNCDSGNEDLAGNLRLAGIDIDIGAYEGAVAGHVISGRVLGDGVLLPMTSVVKPGGSARFEAVETGARFLHFLIDGEVVSESSNYAWENVQADGVITAAFATNTWYVDGARPDDNGDGRTWATAKKTIQAAVEIAGKDDLILVNPGIYGPVDASAHHPFVIRSVQGPEATIIDAAGKTRCATLGKVRGEAGAVLDGFTLRHGCMGEGGGAMGGALNNCLLLNNLAYNGGGAAYCTLNNCTLTGNTARTGGGAWTSALTHCILTGNTADDDGGGAVFCIMNNCTLTDNAASDFGGGSWESTLNNCLLARNSAQYCGAAADCTLTNCTVSGNTAIEQYGGVYTCTLYNSIVWGNTAKYKYYENSAFYYSCTDYWAEGGNNISENPMFVDAVNGDYRLAANSPCVNMGNNSFAVGETDLAGNPRIRAGQIDMGALEAEGFIIIGRILGAGEMYPQDDAVYLFPPQEDMAFGVFVVPGASLTFEAVETGRSFRHFLVDGVVVSESPSYTWENIQADGVITAVFESKTWYVDDDGDGDGSSWENALPSIQSAIDAAADGDTILVNDGIYDPIWTWNRPITIRSLNGADKAIIDGWWNIYDEWWLQERCATLADDSSGHKTILDGFTLQNGYAEYGGGGAYGGTLSNCILAGNKAGFDGGGAYDCILTNCTLTGNEAGRGGGAYDCTLTNCTLTGNSTRWYGGGACDCTLTSCTLTENQAERGGGVYESTLTDCTLTENTAKYGGGGAYGGILTNCTLTGNTATSGGGAYGGTLTDCTLTGNQASNGGGVYESTLTDCTLTENTAEYGGGGAYGGTLTNCTLTGNSSETAGGGAADSCELFNCTLTGNFTYDWGGGASGSTLHNCLLAGNATAGAGGAVNYSFLTNCLLIDNYARFGGGASDSTLRNCTLASNEAWQQGGGAYDCALANCIIWGNTAPKGENFYIKGNESDGDDGDGDPEPGDDAGLAYCCATPLADGQGNIDLPPRFVDPANGDYRLRAGSPCVNAGDTTLVSGDGETDLAGNPRIGNGAVDMGAYEGVVSGFVISGRVEGYGEIIPPNAVVSAGASVTFEAKELGRAFSHFLVNGERVSGSAKTYVFPNIQADAEIVAVFANKTWYADVNNGDDEGTGLSWGDAKRSIQAAIDEAVDGDVIEVAAGDYQPIATDNKAIVIQSAQGSEKTSISGGEYQRCATLCNGLSKPKTTLIGFTLQNGVMEKTVYEFVDGVHKEIYYWGDGGGARGGTLINCHLLNNSASYGGGASYCTLINCKLTGNYASQGFGDFDEAGGGAYMCVLNNCELRENSAERSGGGACDCRLTNCTLYDNWTNSSGGGACWSTLINCLLAFNRAEEYGGGVAKGSSLTNCTLTENEASWGGGIHDCRIVNCIVWGNRADEAGDNYYGYDPDFPDASPFLYTCTDPLPEGEGNICDDPLFVDVEANDFRLSAESPCMEAGSNAFAVGDVDLAGNPRILYRVVDMGAFERVGTYVFKYVWQSGWNTLYLPFDSLEQDAAEALAKMPVFRLSADAYVKDKPVSRHTPLWVFCADPESAPVLRGVLTSGAPPDPLAIPAGQWTQVGAQRQVETLPDGYAAWEWRTRRYVRVQSLQAGRVYFIY